MDPTTLGYADLFSRATAEREATLEAFESAWSRGERPAIEAFLPSAGADGRLLGEFAQSEMEFRLRVGEPMTAHDYLGRFPILAADHEAAAELIAAELRLAGGSAGSTPADLLRRYPEYADALASRLAMRASGDTPGLASTLPSPTPEHDGLASTLPSGAPASGAVTPSLGGAAGAEARYRSVRFHARGGIGEVHLAQDAELGRERPGPEFDSRPPWLQTADDARRAIETNRRQTPTFARATCLGHIDRCI